MKPILLGLLICLLLFLTLISLKPSLSSNISGNVLIDNKVDKEIEEGNARVIVILKKPEVKRTFFATKKLNEEERREEIKKIKENIFSDIGKEKIRYEYENTFTAEISKAELLSLRENKDIQEIRHLEKIKAFLQDSVGIVNATSSWNLEISGINITGQGETICIIDSGINYSHPDLQGKIIAQKCYCQGALGPSGCCPSGLEEETNALDDNGHGTHVAGIVAANGLIKGIAPDANIVAVKVLNADGDGSFDDLKAAIDWCISNASIYNITVISMSLGTTTLYSSYCDSTYLGIGITESINNAIANNISVIAATGNDNNITAIASPACIKNVTAVAATTKQDNMASFSNRNEITDLVAPGENINSTYLTGYNLLSGTSMSAPHVVGAFALIRQARRIGLNNIFLPSEIENKSKEKGKQINDTTGNSLLYSRIDIYLTILSLSLIDIDLILPLNGTSTKNSEQNFSCNISIIGSENISQLSNITFYLWNSTNLIYNETTNITGITNSTEFNYSFSQEDNYLWTCQARDNRSYFSIAQNFSFRYDTTQPYIEVISPKNSSWYNAARFNISLNEAGDSCLFSLDNLANVTMTKFNNTYFNFTNSTIEEAMHNVTFYCNDTAGNLNKSQMVYFNIDRTSPIVNLSLPQDGYSTTSTSITFYYNVSDNLNISICSLVIDDGIVSYNLSFVNKSETNNITATISIGNHVWQINCTDSAGNQGNSSSRSLTISSPPVSITSNGGGGIVEKGITYVLTEEQAKRGVTKEIEKNDKIKFTLQEQGKSKEHYIIINSIEKTKVDITINSTPINIIFYIGDVKKFELTNDSYYDLEIKLNNITNNKVNLTVKIIQTLIPLPKLPEEVEENKTIGTEKEEKKEKIKYSTFTIMTVIVILIAILILFAVLKIKLKKSKKNAKYKTEQKAETKAKSKRKEKIFADKFKSK